MLRKKSEPLSYLISAALSHLAFKYTYQRGDFYAFDDNFTSYNDSFIAENPTLANQQLKPTKLNLDRYNVAVTLGYKF